ncbi:MAG: Smr/MutS family protein [Brevirhabdus sp.]
MRRKPRGLSPEDIELWDKVRKSAEPLNRRPLPEPAAGPVKAPKTIKVERTVNPGTFRVGEKARPVPPGHDLAPSVGQKVAAQPVRMDKNRFGDMKRGKIKPEARIDLHGMTLAQAHPALNAFVIGQYERGARLVLVITGKGKSKPEPGPIPTRVGVLKHQVPHWLTSPPLSQVVLQISQAHQRHGGIGAYYVYLKRRR